MEKFTIVKEVVKKIRKYNLTGRTVKFKLKPVPLATEPVGWVKEAINQVITKATEGLEPSDHVGFSFCSNDFSWGEGYVLHLQRILNMKMFGKL